MTLLGQLRTILAALDGAGIEYALVGGLAVAVWGAPRATQDIDLLVRPEPVDAIVAAIEPLGFRFRATCCWSMRTSNSHGLRVGRSTWTARRSLQIASELSELCRVLGEAGRRADGA